MIHRQALGCAYGDKTRWVLEQTRLWNGQQWRQSNNEILDESKSFKQMVNRSLDAYLKVLLRQYQLQLLHKKKCGQILLD